MHDGHMHCCQTCPKDNLADPYYCTDSRVSHRTILVIPTVDISANSGIQLYGKLHALTGAAQARHIAKLLDAACLASSEHIDDSEHQPGRTKWMNVQVREDCFGVARFVTANSCHSDSAFAVANSWNR